LGSAAGRIECKKKLAAADKLLLGVISVVHFCVTEGWIFQLSLV